METLTALEDIPLRRVLPIELIDLLEVLFPRLNLLAAFIHESFIVAGFLIVVAGLKEEIPVGRGKGGFHF